MSIVAQMTKDELREMIETTIEQKLLELLGDPDEGPPMIANSLVASRSNSVKYI